MATTLVLDTDGSVAGVEGLLIANLDLATATGLLAAGCRTVS
jgi:hypothetical protein